MAERRQEEKKSDRRINPRTRPSLGADSEGAEEMHHNMSIPMTVGSGMIGWRGASERPRRGKVMDTRGITS
jgi:hypothetical protein